MDWSRDDVRRPDQDRSAESGAIWLPRQGMKVRNMAEWANKVVVMVTQRVSEVIKGRSP